MYLLHVVNHVEIGETTGIVNVYKSNFHSETLRPLLKKCNDILDSKSYHCRLSFSFYKVDRLYVTEILENSFDFQKLEDFIPVLYFSDIGRKTDE